MLSVAARRNLTHFVLDSLKGRSLAGVKHIHTKSNDGQSAQPQAAQADEE